MHTKRFRIISSNFSLNVSRSLFMALALLTFSALTFSAFNGLWPAFALAEALQETVDSANAYANNSNYKEAIPLYEKAVKTAVQENNSGAQTLKNNLAVLYFNYGIEFQNNKQYDKANAYLDQSLALIPDQPQALKAKAASFYYQGMDLRDVGSQDFAQLKSLFQKAIELDPDTVTYKKALASVYLGEARNLANEQQYAQAVGLLKTARTLDPDALALKKSLANIYLGLASQQGEDKAGQKESIEKALAIDSSPLIRQRAKQISTGKLDYGKQTGTMKFPNSASNPVVNNAPSVPQQTANWSIQDKLSAIEKALDMEVNSDSALITRLNLAEKQVFGKEQKGALDERSEQLFKTLLGSAGTVQESLPHLIQVPIQTAANTYLEDIFKYTDGKVVRWARFPVRVYIEPPKDHPLYKEEFETAVFEGFDGWKGASNSFVSYVKVKNPLAADIQIYWDDDYTDRFIQEKSYENNILKNYTPPKRSKLAQTIGMASMFAPGPFALAPQAISAGLQYRQARKIQILADESNITLGLNLTKDLPLEKALILIQNMAAYEFGHALGLKGVSHNPDDLMYPEGITSQEKRHPSQRDMATLREIYTRPANVVLNIH